MVERVCILHLSHDHLVFANLWNDCSVDSVVARLGRLVWQIQLLHQSTVVTLLHPVQYLIVLSGQRDETEVLLLLTHVHRCGIRHLSLSSIR